MEIPQAFVKTTLEMFGSAGQAWLDTLPALLDDLADGWEIEIGPPFAGLTYNFVAPAVGPKGEMLVIKVGVGSAEDDREPLALLAYAERGAVRLVARRADHRAMLLERIDPGTMLREISDEAAQEIAADLMSKLWLAAPPADLPDLGTWTCSLDAFEAEPGPLPHDLVERAGGLRRELLRDPPELVLLHGDIHHTNVLRSAERGWLAIDPKGVVGEKAYEIPVFLLNAEPNSLEAIQRRIAFFVERLVLDRERVAAWSFVQAVISACWTVEDGGEGWEAAIGFAERVKSLSL